MKSTPSIPEFRLLAFNKPMNVLTRFTDDQDRPNLSRYISIPGVYPVGRLDKTSEGLLLLTDRGSLVEPLLKPGEKTKTYLVCVEGCPDREQLSNLADGPVLKDGPCRPAEVELLEEQPEWLWPREPPIRYRKSIPVSWLTISITEGRNRQVRRMTAAVGLPTLRLVRTRFAHVELDLSLQPGEWRELSPVEKAIALKLEGRKKPRSHSPRPRAKSRARKRPSPPGNRGRT